MKRKKELPLQNRSYFVNADVQQMLNVGQGVAYRIIREINEHEKEAGHLVMKGRVNKMAFYATYPGIKEVSRYEH